MTLYNKRVKGIACRTGWVYPEDSLKQAIKDLKKEIEEPLVDYDVNKEIIDKIFGVWEE